MNEWMNEWWKSWTINSFFEESKNEWKKKVMNKTDETKFWARMNEWMVEVLNKMVETRLQARMNEWMNGKSIEQNGWNKISSMNEW
jgi:hypothetical protein